MASELGALIAQMRAQVPPVPYAQIAAQLGISVGKVQRELAKATAGAPPSAIAAAAGIDPTPLGLDPDLRERRKSIEMRRLELAELEMSSRRFDLEQRLTVLQNAGKGGDSAILALVMGELARLRDRLEAPQAAPGRNLVDTLSEYREIGQVVKSFADSHGPTGQEGVEYAIALRRIESEERRILKQQQDELDIRRRQIEGQASRDDALAKLIEGFAPVLTAFVQRQVDGPPKAPPPALPAASADGSPAPAGEPGRGKCPRCGYPHDAQDMELVPSGGEDKCPGCGALLAVAGGRIVLAGTVPAAAAPAASNGHAAAAANAEPPRFMS